MPTPNLPRAHAHALPAPHYEDAGGAPFGGDVSVFPVREGRSVELSFPSPYERMLLLDGKRVRSPSDDDELSLAIWSGRRLLALYQALGTAFGLRGVYRAGTISAFDVVDKESGAFLDHRAIQKQLAPVDILLPPFAILGDVGSTSELAARVRAMYASGTILEVRQEDGGTVFARRRYRVGRG